LNFHLILLESKPPLTDDEEDLSAVLLFHKRLAAGEEELIPSEFVNRMIDGENKVGFGASTAVCRPATSPRRQGSASRNWRGSRTASRMDML